MQRLNRTDSVQNLASFVKVTRYCQTYTTLISWLFRELAILGSYEESIANYTQILDTIER